MRRRANTGLAVAAIAICSVLAGCGDSGTEVPPTAGPGAPGAPALLERELKPGEFLIEAEATPRRAGPIHFDGRYRVSFAQYAPEAPAAPERTFADSVPFVAELRPPANPARPIRIFHAAAKEGTRTLKLHGRYEVEVLFGDFPFVLRFTPVD